MSLRSFVVATLFVTAQLFANAAPAQMPEVGGVWETMAPMPDLRTEVSVTSDGQRLYVLGGFGIEAGQVTAPLAVYSYDPTTDSWLQLTDLPAGVNHAGLVYLDGLLYVVGGHSGTSFNPTDQLMIYDIAGDEWRRGPPMPTPRGAAAVAILDGRIHVIGGETPSGITGVHEVFDPATNSWATAAPMPTPREHISAASVGTEIVVLGGRNGETSTMTTNEIYDAATDSWRAGADVPTGRSGTATVALDGKVYFFGGEQFDDVTGTFDAAERYDPATDRWERLPPMPTARHGLGAGVINGRIYVISGGPEAGFAFSDLNERLTPAP
jgi:N-acetylneuraminic acid mutarotase